MRKVAIGLLLIMLASCAKKNATLQELKAYVADKENGLAKAISKDDVTIEVTYRPTDLVWARELLKAKDKKVQDEFRENYDSLIYFVISFSRNGSEIENRYTSDPSKFTKVINHLSYDIDRDLSIVLGKDTTQAMDVVFSRTFGGANATSLMAIFSGTDLANESRDITVLFNDTMFGLGSNQFEFKINDIKNTPSLMLN
jgi:hypothetical protein